VGLLLLDLPPVSISEVAPVEEYARRVCSPFLRGGDALILPRARAFGAFTVVRFAEQRDGVEVADRGASVVIGPRGTTALVALAGPLPSSIPHVNVHDAIAAARAVEHLPLDALRAHLAYAEIAGQGHLTWRIPAAVPDAAPTRPVIVVDAHDGRVLLRFDAVRAAGEALVHRTNPVASPALDRVALPLLPAAATTLSAPELRARSCVDRMTVKKVGSVDLHVCDLEHLANADTEGNFLVAPPIDAAATHAFSETQAFFHAATAARFFRDHGLSDVVPRPLEVIASAKWPPGWLDGSREQLGCATCPLDPMANAFYAPADPAAPSSVATVFGVDRDAIFLGLGRTRSYAVDGDIVHHEWAHAVIQHTIGLVATPKLDAQGVSFAPAAANEALADYFAAKISGDPRIGEYASGEGAEGEGSARSLSSDARCPEAIVGEVHADSLILSGALWSAGTDPRAVLAALVSAPSGDVSYDELGALLARDEAALRDELSRRGVTGCLRVRRGDGPIRAAAPRGFVAPGRRTVGVTGLVPPVVQFARAVPERTSAVTIKFRSSTALRAFVRVRAPIVYDVLGVHTVDGEVPLTRDGEFVRGTYALPAGDPGGDLFLAIESDSETDARYDDVELTASPKLATDEPGGCGCRTANGNGGGAWALAIALLAWRRRA